MAWFQQPPPAPPRPPVEVAIVGHGNWDRQTRFTVPAGISLGFFYPAESGTSLCYSPSQIPALCRQQPVDVRTPGQQSPDFMLTGDLFVGVPGAEGGLRNCDTNQVLFRFESGQRYMLSAIVNEMSRGVVTSPGGSATMRILVCGGEGNLLNPITGQVTTEAEGLAAMYKRNAQMAYDQAILGKFGEAFAQRLYGLIASGMPMETAMQTMQTPPTRLRLNTPRYGGSRRRRRKTRKSARKGTKRISYRRNR